jgi:hypothetical protein
MPTLPLPELIVLALCRSVLTYSRNKIFNNFFFFRLPLFLGCRRFLLRSLYSDLQTLSSGPALEPQSPLTPGHSRGHGSFGSIELDSLPLPASAGSTPSKSKFAPTNTASLHSAAAGNVFSLVFTESSMMFFVLMLQGASLLDSS